MAEAVRNENKARLEEQAELTGREVPLGQHDPLREVVRIPKYLGFLAMIGPGMIYAAMAQGSGELIFWPYMMAKYGAAFIGLLLPACALQYPVSIEIGRYTVTTGETMFTGFKRANIAFAWFMWIMLFAQFLWFGGYASGGATAVAALTHFPAGWSARGQTLFWSYVMIAVFSLAIWLGPIIYNLIEKFMSVVVVVTILGLIGASFHPVVRQYWGDFFGRLFTFRVFWPANFEAKDWDVFLTIIASAGMGGFWNVMYSYWLRDKRAGLAGFMGRITSPITGKPEVIPATGYVFQDTEENRKQYRGWVRYVFGDQGIATGANTFTLVLNCLLAYSILHPQGLVPSGWKLAVVQAEYFRTSWGVIGQMVFLVVAAAFLGDSWLGITDVVGRMHADFFVSNFRFFRKWGLRNTYYLWVTLLGVISCITLPLAQPATLLIAGSVIGFIAMSLYCPVLIYINYFLLPRVYPKWVRPSNTALCFISLVSVIYLILTIWYLSVKF